MNNINIDPSVRARLIEMAKDSGISPNFFVEKILTEFINNNEENSLPKLLSVKDVRDYLKIRNQDAYKLCRKSTFPSFKSGKKYLVFEDDFLDYLRHHKKI